MIQIKRSELKQLAQNKLGNDSIESQNKILVMISAALSARTSYTVVGDEKEVDYKKMLELHDRLAESGHWSPFEHVARTMSKEEYLQYFRSSGNVKFKDKQDLMKSENGWCRNFKGFIQYRSLIDNNNE